MRRRNLLHLVAGGTGAAGTALLGGCTGTVSRILGSNETCSTGQYGRWCHPDDGYLESVASGSVFAIETPTRHEVGQVVPLDADTGGVQWSYGDVEGQGGHAGFTVEDGVYVSSCTDQGCHRLNALTVDGEERWTRDLAAAIPRSSTTERSSSGAALPSYTLWTPRLERYSGRPSPKAGMPRS